MNMTLNLKGSDDLFSIRQIRRTNTINIEALINKHNLDNKGDDKEDYKPIENPIYNKLRKYIKNLKNTSRKLRYECKNLLSAIPCIHRKKRTIIRNAKPRLHENISLIRSIEQRSLIVMNNINLGRQQLKNKYIRIINKQPNRPAVSVNDIYKPNKYIIPRIIRKQREITKKKQEEFLRNKLRGLIEDMQITHSLFIKREGINNVMNKSNLISRQKTSKSVSKS